MLQTNALKSLATSLTLFFVFFTFAQIEIKPGVFPFNQVTEWPGHGTLIFGVDPSGRSQEINFHLINYEGEISWNRSVYPKNKKTHLIVSRTSNYIYFMDDLTPHNNQFRYNQVGLTGNVIPTNFDVLSIIRRHGYQTPNELILKDIVNTPKALVFYFQLPVIERGIIENIFISITHHNNRVYSCLGPASEVDLMNEGEQFEFIFAGADDETISFSRYKREKAFKDTEFFTFSTKAKVLGYNSIRPIDIQPIPSSVYSLDLDGRYYLNKEIKNFTNTANGYGFYFQGEAYYAAFEEGTLCLKIYGKDEKGDFSLLTDCNRKAPSKRQKFDKPQLTTMNYGNKMVVVGNLNGEQYSYQIDKNGVKEIKLNAIDWSQIRNNPSSLLVGVDNISKRFIHLINDIPYYIEISELQKSDQIVFKKL